MRFKNKFQHIAFALIFAGSIFISAYAQEQSLSYSAADTPISTDSLAATINAESSSGIIPLAYRHQPSAFSPNQSSRGRLFLVSSLTALGMAGTYVAHIEPWWSGEKQGFRFKFDWVNNYWLEIDKLGHFYANIQLTRATASMFRFAGISRRKALWIGAANSTLLYTAFELTDAGFADWGFSVPDYVANILGASYPILQDYYPFLQRFQFKISYYPSRYYKDDSYADAPGFIRYYPYQYPAGDYDGMRFWLSAEVDPFLPTALQSYWPDWLNIAVGYGASNLPQANRELKYRDWYLSLDYNLEKLPGNSAFLRSLKSLLNAFHFPAPAIRINRHGSVAYLLRF